MPNKPDNKQSGEMAAQMMAALANLQAQSAEPPGYTGLMGAQPMYFIPGGMNYPMAPEAMRRTQVDPAYAQRYATEAQLYSEPWNAGAMRMAGIPQRFASGAPEQPKYIGGTPYVSADGKTPGSDFTLDYFRAVDALPYGMFTPVVDQLGNRTEYSPDAPYYYGPGYADMSPEFLEMVRAENKKSK